MVVQDKTKKEYARDCLFYGYEAPVNSGNARKFIRLIDALHGMPARSEWQVPDFVTAKPRAILVASSLG
jgi:hypothetical protein